MDALPLVGRVPLQSPVAVHVVAFAADQVSCALPPCCTAVGSAVNVSVGAGAVTFTVTVCEALPPGPVQVSWKLVVWDSAAVVVLPDIPLDPVQPPDAVQLLAPVVDQLRVLVLPDMTEVGFAVRLTVGNGAGVT